MRRVVALLAVLVIGAGCGGGVTASSPPGSSNAIVVGSFDFAESVLLGEIYATALQENGFPVRREFELGSREIVQPALEQDHVDLVPEYLGAAVTFASLGKVEATSSAEEMHRRLETLLGDRGLLVLDYARAQDRNGIVVTEATAMKYNLIRISDLVPFAPELEFGGPPECPERPTCLAGLERVYGADFQAFHPLDVGGPETVAALQGGEVDVALLFTTDPSITSQDFALLVDDKHLQPAENVVPVIRKETVERHGRKVVEILDSVSSHLTTDGLRSLNERAASKGASAVATNWLRSIGVID